MRDRRPGEPRAYGVAARNRSRFRATSIEGLRRCYCFASGAFSTALQTAGSADIGIGGFGFGGTFGGFG
jgi:hypothetical protein